LSERENSKHLAESSKVTGHLKSDIERRPSVWKASLARLDVVNLSHRWRLLSIFAKWTPVDCHTSTAVCSGS